MNVGLGQCGSRQPIPDAVRMVARLGRDTRFDAICNHPQGPNVPNRSGITDLREIDMGMGRYLAAAALTTILALPVAAQTASPNRPSAAAPNSTHEQGALIDINSASSAELDKLPGIGSARAQAIIANRPYKGKDELAQRKIVPQSVYDQIKDKIVARQAPTSGGSGSTTPLPGSPTKSK
jgi:competence protein ComEA